MSATSAVAAAAAAARQGRAAVVVNDLRAVGVVALPISQLTPDHITFMVTECRGIVYAGIPSARLSAMRIPRQSTAGAGPDHIHVPIDLTVGTSTGVSSSDRSRTIRALLDPAMSVDDFRVPGHVVPMAMADDGIFGRLGLAEAAQVVADAAGAGQGVALCGVMDAEGLMAHPGQLAEFASHWELPLLSIADALATERANRGWTDHPPKDVLRLPYAGVVAHIRAVGEPQVRPMYPVEVFPLCAGHALGSCACQPRMTAIHEVLDHGEYGAAVAIQRTGDLTCAEPLPRTDREAIARIVAADRAAAPPTAFPFHMDIKVQETLA